jgi:hypothetical protein
VGALAPNHETVPLELTRRSPSTHRDFSLFRFWPLRFFSTLYHFIQFEMRPTSYLNDVPHEWTTELIRNLFNGFLFLLRLQYVCAKSIRATLNREISKWVRMTTLGHGVYPC